MRKAITLLALAALTFAGCQKSEGQRQLEDLNKPIVKINYSKRGSEGHYLVRTEDGNFLYTADHGADRAIRKHLDDITETKRNLRKPSLWDYVQRPADTPISHPEAFRALTQMDTNHDFRVSLDEAKALRYNFRNTYEER